MCPQQMLRARANGEIFVAATMCPQRVLVCQGLNIPQKEGINIVCNAYETFHLNKPPIPILYLRDMLGLILKENSFHLNKKNYLQTHGTAMGPKLAVSLTNIFTAAVKRKIINGATSSRTLGKDISMMSFLYGTKTKRK